VSALTLTTAWALALPDWRPGVSAAGPDLVSLFQAQSNEGQSQRRAHGGKGTRNRAGSERPVYLQAQEGGVDSAQGHFASRRLALAIDHPTRGLTKALRCKLRVGVFVRLRRVL
jgi:hypothetical protein